MLFGWVFYVPFNLYIKGSDLKWYYWEVVEPQIDKSLHIDP